MLTPLTSCLAWTELGIARSMLWLGQTILEYFRYRPSLKLSCPSNHCFRFRQQLHVGLTCAKNRFILGLWRAQQMICCLTSCVILCNALYHCWLLFSLCSIVHELRVCVHPHRFMQEIKLIHRDLLIHASHMEYIYYNYCKVIVHMGCIKLKLG